MIIRKGLHKFFDLGVEFLDFENIKEDIPAKIRKSKNTSKIDNRLSSIILNPVRKAFESKDI